MNDSNMHGERVKIKKVGFFFVLYGTRKQYLIENYYHFGLFLGARLLYLRA
jgi:hypothetical protein